MRKNAAKCGTYSGAIRHIKRGEPSCDPCKAAHAEYQEKWRRQNPTAARRHSQIVGARAKAARRVAEAHPDEFAQALRDELANRGLL